MSQVASIFNNVPDELQQHRSWVCWRYAYDDNGKQTKVPVSPLTRRNASPTNPSDWTDFRTAFNVLMGDDDLIGLGFVLSPNDPYAFVDIDLKGDDVTDEIRANAEKLIEEFASYTEISPSGSGYHIIVRGSVEKGRKRNPLEIYSSERFMTMTGRVYKDLPIAERNESLNQLWTQLAPSRKEVFCSVSGDAPEKYSDQEIVDMASRASNGYKFYQLWNGNWQQDYSSQSEADFALVDILAFYTENFEQVKRLFRFSALGQRSKAHDDKYLDRILPRAYDNKLDSIDISALRQMTTSELTGVFTQVAEEKALINQPIITREEAKMIEVAEEIGNKHCPFPYSFPDGLLGVIAYYFYQRSPRPTIEVSLAGAIAVMAGICGKAYNISGAGVNQYTVIVAETGIGKEGVQHGADSLMHAVSKTCPAAANFIGASHIASPQALIKRLAEQPCFVSFIGEFGLFIKQITAPNASEHRSGLKRALLDLYSKSGQNSVIRATIYSDKEKNIPDIQAPAFSLLGDTTGQQLYGALSEDLVGEGIVPRMTIIEYYGTRPPLNYEAHLAQPSTELITATAQLCDAALRNMQAGGVTHVAQTPECEAATKAFNAYCDEQWNNAPSKVHRALWTRAYLKAMKLAALVSVGKNWYTPVMTVEDFEWAKKAIINEVMNITAKFASGEIGESDNGVYDQDQIDRLHRAIGDYLRKGSTDSASSGCVNQRMLTDKVIPYAYMMRKVSGLACFRRDRRGGSTAIASATRVLVETGVLIEVPKAQAQRDYATTARLFVIVDPDRMVKM